MKRVLIVAMCSVVCSVAGAQQGSDRHERLEALDPGEPMVYFELAESIAYEYADDVSQLLARHLFILAMELDRRALVPEGLSSSVCFALADLAHDASERVWLIALAESLVREAQHVSWQPMDSLVNPDDEEKRFALVEAIAQQRDGNARDAMRLSQEPETRRVLERYEEFIPSGVENFLQEMTENTSCRECRNRRFSRDARGGYRVCITCGGNPGRHLRREELIESLRLEAAMLGAQPDSWSGDLLLRGDAPMRTLRVEEIAPWFGVDPLKPLFRGGVWVSEGE